MGSRTWRSTAVATALLAGGSLVWALVRSPAEPFSSSGSNSAAAEQQLAAAELAQRDIQISVWRQALDADPISAVALGHLAALHVQRAREGQSADADYQIAEEYARRSLDLRTKRNGAAAATLVSTLLAQHRFDDAYTEAVKLVQREPDVPQYRAILGEVAIEVGDDTLARQMFASVWTDRARLSTAPRLARWLELNGHVREARRILTDAQRDALSRRDVAIETKAWFALRLGDLELRAGHPRAAEKAYRAGLLIQPGDIRLFAAMARLGASESDWRAVIQWGERAIDLQLDPATIGLVADAYHALGDSARGAEYAQAVAVSLSAMTGGQHRAGALYLLDHGIQVNDILVRAEQDLVTRRDVYGYDMAAWALYQSGRVAEARVMMQHALRLGTQDPLLARHAEAIDSAIATLAASSDASSLVQAGALR